MQPGRAWLTLPLVRVSVRFQVFLANMDDFAAVNAVYTRFFGEHKPARSAVQVARLPLNALFEIECIARCGLCLLSTEMPGADTHCYEA